MTDEETRDHLAWLMIHNSFQLVSQEAKQRMHEFRVRQYQSGGGVPTWTEDLAWAWTDEEWGVVLMAMTLEGADNDRV